MMDDRVETRPPAGSAPRSERMWGWIGEGEKSDWTFARRVLIALGLAALAYAAWKISAALILAFAAVVVGVLLRGFANRIGERFGLSEKWSLAAASLAVLAAMAALGLIFALQVYGEVQTLAERLPQALRALGERIGVNVTLEDAAKSIAAPAAPGSETPAATGAAQAVKLGVNTLSAVADFVLVLSAGVFLAANPPIYVQGALLVLPPSQRERAREALHAIAVALRGWFLAQLIVMAIVGVTSAAAFWLLGAPGALALGVIAGVAEIVPIVGPIASGAVAAVMASAVDVKTMGYVVLAAIAIQQLEGNVITPRVQSNAVDVPGALVIFSIVAFGALFGTLGVFLAMPLAVSAMILVQKLWVNETLGEHVALAGSEEAKEKKKDEEEEARGE